LCLAALVCDEPQQVPQHPVFDTISWETWWQNHCFFWQCVCFETLCH